MERRHQQQLHFKSRRKGIHSIEGSSLLAFTDRAVRLSFQGGQKLEHHGGNVDHSIISVKQ